MLTVFGSINMDLIMRVPALPRPGETVLTESYATKPGGKGANQAVAAARSGGSVAMAGAVGPDGYGRALVENLRANGADASGVSQGTAPTGIAYICVDDAAENFIAVASGANLEPRADRLSDAALGAGNTLLMQMEIPPEENWAAIERAGRLGARTVLNVAPAAPVPAAVLDRLDVLIVNEHEARTVAAATGLGDGAEAGALPALAQNLVESHGLICLITVGADGVVFAGPGQSAPARIPAMPIEPVDTTGAGDAFCGIFAAGLDSGLALLPALNRAVAGSALACLALGAQESLPVGAEIDRALNDLKPPVAL